MARWQTLVDDSFLCPKEYARIAIKDIYKLSNDDSAVSRQKKDAEANWKSQGQMLTAVEYGLVLYHAVLPPPIWYRFFLNREYGENMEVSFHLSNGQMLTAVEYGLVLYHAVLPAPVWYRFFLNREYGGIQYLVPEGGIVS
ncbi:hypothetical protein QQ045_020873 [Rhodiola kirilowii]